MIYPKPRANSSPSLATLRPIVRAVGAAARLGVAE